jgi:hypothetical protein
MTQQPEPFPLDRGDRIAFLESQRDRLQSQCDARDARISELSVMCLRRRDLLSTCRDVLHAAGFDHLCERIRVEIGGELFSTCVEQPRGSVPIQGMH